MMRCISNCDTVMRGRSCLAKNGVGYKFIISLRTASPSHCLANGRTPTGNDRSAARRKLDEALRSLVFNRAPV